MLDRLFMLNTATLSTRTLLAPKPWITFRGHSRSRVLGSLKSRPGTAYYCIIMWSLKSEMSKERSEHIRFLEPHCHSEPCLYRKPCEYSHKCYTLEATFIRLHFRRWLCECVRLSSLVFCGGLESRMSRVKQPVLLSRTWDSRTRTRTRSQLQGKGKDKDLMSKDEDKDKDEDLKIGPRRQKLSSRTATP